MTQEALKLALDALETELSIDWTNNDEFNASAEKMYEAIAAIKETLALQAQEPVAHSVIAGVLFDFMGWLTSRKERIVLSSADNASPAVDAIRDFAKMRNLSLDDARVLNWNTTPPQRTEQEHMAYASIKIRVGNMHTQQFITQEMLHNIDDPWRLVTIYAEQCIEELKEMDT